MASISATVVNTFQEVVDKRGTLKEGTIKEATLAGTLWLAGKSAGEQVMTLPELLECIYDTLHDGVRRVAADNGEIAAVGTADGHATSDGGGKSSSHEKSTVGHRQLPHIQSDTSTTRADPPITPPSPPALPPSNLSSDAHDSPFEKRATAAAGGVASVTCLVPSLIAAPLSAYYKTILITAWLMPVTAGNRTRVSRVVHM